MDNNLSQSRRMQKTQQTNVEELDILINNPSWGGSRVGSGRPKGSLNKATLERIAVEEEVQNRILSNVHELLTKQLDLAIGKSYLFRMVETERKKKYILVKDPEKVANYIDHLVGDKYIYITTRAPNIRALESLIDRVFGKSVQRSDLTSDYEPIPILP